MQILLLGYKIKNAVQKSTPPEAKNFRDFHSQMQFSLNKLHFPDEKSASFSPAPSAPAKIFAPPQPDFGGGQNGRFWRWWGGRPPTPPPMSAPAPPPFGGSMSIALPDKLQKPISSFLGWKTQTRSLESEGQVSYCTQLTTASTETG